MTAEAQPSATVNYTVPRNSVITLNITRPDGYVVRELVVGERHAAGQYSVVWDGRDNYGSSWGTGEYQARILTHDGISAEYVTSVGNSGTPPWRTEDGTGGWGGNQGNVIAVCRDSTGVYMGWNAGEGPFTVVKRTPDGSEGVWGQYPFPFKGVTQMAAEGQYVYIANERDLLKLHQDNGQHLARTTMTTGRLAGETEPLAPEGTASFNFTRDDQDGHIWGMAASSTRVYVSAPWRNSILVFRTSNLSRVAAEDLPVHRPRGLALDETGNLLVVSDGQVFSINLANKAKVPVITTNLDAPFALSRNSTDGSLFITELGTTQQVKKFSATGQLLATFGRRGGAFDFALNGEQTLAAQGKGGGEFAPRDFRNPCSIAALPGGGFWLAEDMIPKRVARFSPTGVPTYQGFGSVNGSALTAANPNEPGEVFSTMWGTFTGRIDYDQKTWAIGRILRPRWGNGGSGLMEERDWGWAPDRLLARDGKTYMWTEFGLFLVEADHLRPVMTFLAGIENQGAITQLAISRGFVAQGWNTVAMMWVDRNGDAASQLSEIQFVPVGPHGPQYFGFRSMADDFTLFASYGFSWKPRSFTAAGVPLYEPGDLVAAAGFNARRDESLFGESPTRDSAGNYYAVFNYDNPALPRGVGFWSSRSSEVFLRSYTPDWRVRWEIGRKATSVARPGEMHYLWRNCGELGNCVLVSDVEGLVHVINKEGFSAGYLMTDLTYYPRPYGPHNLNVELMSGSVMEHPTTHKKYLYISSDQASLVFEIKGLESMVVSAPQPVTLR